MEAGTVRKDRAAAGDDSPELTPHDKVRQASDPKHGAAAVAQMNDGDKADALSWFLEDDEASSEPLTHTFQINVAGPDDPERFVDWTIRSLDMDTIDSIRQKARAGSRAQRRAGTGDQVNEMKAALGMVAAATVSPDLEQVRSAKGAVNREQVLQHRFRSKPGLILQISGKVLELSGYDEEDVREAVAAKN